MTTQPATVGAVTYAWGIQYTSRHGQHVEEQPDEDAARLKVKHHRGQSTAVAVRAVRGPWEEAPPC